MKFRERATAQLKMLNDGKPLEAIDEFYANDIIMYDNDQVFAEGKIESRGKQEPYIKSAVAIYGKVEEELLNEQDEVSIYRNKSKFKTESGEEIQIDGLCWQQWRDGVVIIERYYSGELMNIKIKEFYRQ